MCFVNASVYFSFGMMFGRLKAFKALCRTAFFLNFTVYLCGLLQ